MISDLKLLWSLKLSLSRQVASGDWPDAEQGVDALQFNLNGVDITKWSGAYVAKVAVAAGATVTVDLRNFTSLLFETAQSLPKVFLMAARADAAAPASPDCEIQINPGGTNGFKGPFVGTTGLTLTDGELFAWSCKPTDITGIATDNTHKTIDLHNVGANDGVLTIFVVGGP